MPELTPARQQVADRLDAEQRVIVVAEELNRLKLLGRFSDARERFPDVEMAMRCLGDACADLRKARAR